MKIYIKSTYQKKKKSSLHVPSGSRHGRGEALGAEAGKLTQQCGMQSLGDAEAHTRLFEGCSSGCFQKDQEDAFESQPPAHGTYWQCLIKKQQGTS